MLCFHIWILAWHRNLAVLPNALGRTAKVSQILSELLVGLVIPSLGYIVSDRTELITILSILCVNFILSTFGFCSKVVKG
jgi:hypothetical protein